MDKEQSARVNLHLLFLLAFQATSALEIDFGALASSLNCVPLHKRLDISQDEIHVGITVSSFEIPMKHTFFLDIHHMYNFLSLYPWEVILVFNSSLPHQHLDTIGFSVVALFNLILGLIVSSLTIPKMFNLTRHYSWQFSRIMHESHTCGPKMLI